MRAGSGAPPRPALGSAASMTARAVSGRIAPSSSCVRPIATASASAGSAPAISKSSRASVASIGTSAGSATPTSIAWAISSAAASAASGAGIAGGAALSAPPRAAATASRQAASRASNDAVISSSARAASTARSGSEAPSAQRSSATASASPRLTSVAMMARRSSTVPAINASQLGSATARRPKSPPGASTAAAAPAPDRTPDRRPVLEREHRQQRAEHRQANTRGAPAPSRSGSAPAERDGQHRRQVKPGGREAASTAPGSTTIIPRPARSAMLAAIHGAAAGRLVWFQALAGEIVSGVDSFSFDSDSCSPASRARLRGGDHRVGYLGNGPRAWASQSAGDAQSR